MTLGQQAGEVAQVRIPADLLAGLDGFFSNLKLRILDRAVRRAALRTGADGTSILQNEDVLAVAPAALTDAVSELGEACHLDEPHLLDEPHYLNESQHVRWTS
jgi:hypothetical protein